MNNILETETNKGVQSSSRYSSFKHPSLFLNKISYFFVTDQLTDVALKAGDTTIKVHKVILAAVSEYFLTMFNCDLLESRAEIVELNEVDGHALRRLVSFAYSGNIDIDEDTAESILSAAVLLQFPEVVEACTRFIVNQLDNGNCIGIALFAESRNCSGLRTAAFAYMEEHILQVMDNEEFLMLSPDELFRILSSENLNTPSEVCLYKGVMKWANHDMENRQQHMQRILGQVKLPLLPPEVLVEEVVGEVGESCSALVIEALSYQVMPQRRNSFPAVRVTPRKSEMGRLIFVEGCERTESMAAQLDSMSSVAEYYPRRDRWSVVAKNNSKRLQVGLASLGRRLCMLGGMYGLLTFNSAEMLDLETLVWKDIAPMFSERSGLGAACNEPEGRMYAVGGHNGWKFLNSVERWDPDTGEWYFVNPMSMPRSNAGVAFLSNRMYVVGGKNGSACLNLLEAYDPMTGKWSACCPMSKRRCGAASVVLDGRLYAVGGYDTFLNAALRHSSVEQYDPRVDRWRDVCPMSVARDGMGAAVLGNRIFAVGGCDGKAFLKTVEEYDPFTDTWNLKFPLGIGCTGSCFVYNKMA